MRIRRQIVSAILVNGLPSQLSSAASTSASKYLDQPIEWYQGTDAARMAENILSFQTEEGGWPKNIDTATKPNDKDHLHATYDNKATTDELRFLARIYDATKQEK